MALPVEPDSSLPQERKEILSRLIPEKHKVVERPTEPDLSAEVREHVETMPGEEVSLPQPVTDDTGAVIVDTPAPQQVTVTLPLTDDQIGAGLTAKVTASVRWLAEWCLRLLKIMRGSFIYHQKKA